MPTKNKILSIVFLGPFGSGKGTQAGLLIEDIPLNHFVMGDALKQEIAKQNVIGTEIESTVKSGNLVGDKIIEQILGDYLDKVKDNQGIIFDGLPRNLQQKKIFDRLMAGHQRDPFFIFIDISPEESKRRMGQRRVCEGCNDQPLGVDFSKKECKKCGGRVAVRFDDSPEIIKHRLGVYDQEVRPVIDQYLAAGKMVRVDGEQEPLLVHLDIMEVIKKYGFKFNELHKK